MNYTIDASVFVASARKNEPHHSESLKFLAQIRAQQLSVVCPSLVLAECGAAIVRRTSDSALALRLVFLVKNFPELRLVDISTPRAERAAQIAAAHRLRGADSIYVAVAEEFTATLITWDTEMLERSPAVVTTLSPIDWINNQTAGEQKL
ncbi:MAG: PIN domain-containing protein [Blastocatellia bacterium]|nr:PIN domain-containing protein [Blastocatellia bacterium]